MHKPAAQGNRRFADASPAAAAPAPPQVWWGVIEDGQPPKQIIEGGEFFVLKKVPATSHH